jgi:hypothetical protein
MYVPGPHAVQTVHVNPALRKEPGEQAQTVSAMALQAVAIYMPDPHAEQSEHTVNPSQYVLIAS